MFEVTLRSDRCFVDVSVGFISISKETGSSFPWPGAIGVVTLGTEVQSEGGGEIHMVYENRLQILDNLSILTSMAPQEAGFFPQGLLQL